jgi:hypothetical protein
MMATLPLLLMMMVIVMTLRLTKLMKTVLILTFYPEVMQIWWR